MNINEKLALYEFCRKEVGEEYCNLKTTRKEQIKANFYHRSSKKKKS